MFYTFFRKKENLPQKHEVGHPTIFSALNSLIESKERLRSFLESKRQAESPPKPGRFQWW